MAKKKSVPVKKAGKKKKLVIKKKITKKVAKKSSKPIRKVASKTKKKQGGKRKSNGSVDLECFLTTACARHLQLGDQCAELQTLRTFRDGYMMSKAKGRELVKDYYHIAPGIVKAIENDSKKTEVYAYIFKEITSACGSIFDNKMIRAQKIYENMVCTLKNRYSTDNI